MSENAEEVSKFEDSVILSLHSFLWWRDQFGFEWEDSTFESDLPFSRPLRFGLGRYPSFVSRVMPHGHHDEFRGGEYGKRVD